jgi:hypothetical protein
MVYLMFRMSAKESGHGEMTRKSGPAEYNRQEQGRVIYRVAATIGKWRTVQAAGARLEAAHRLQRGTHTFLLL